MMAFGLLPDDIRQMLRTSEWEHSRHLKKRLLGERSFPISVNLRPPSGKQALADLMSFHAFVEAWQRWPDQSQISWKTVQYTQLGEKRVPSQLSLGSIQALIEFLGDDAVARSQHWQQLMNPILNVNQHLYIVLVKQLHKVEVLNQLAAELIAQLLPQLRRGMGQGGYLRALPITGVDTKFVETHQALLSQLLDALHDGAVSQSGGLLAWLDCKPVPGDWLLIRPLCEATKKMMGGVPILRMPTEALLTTPLPGKRILVVENDQSGYALPALPETVAVIGGGRNLVWMAATWLNQKQIGYWGDLDTWGFVFLSEARQRQPHVKSLFMDRDTVLNHLERMVKEPDPYPGLPECLTESERMLCQEIRDGVHGNTRLEQERLSAHYIRDGLLCWGNEISLST